MSGAFTTRRFMQHQVRAVADHSPLLRRALAVTIPLGGRVEAALLSPEEAAFIHKQHENNGGQPSSKVIFAVRPPRHALRGLGGGLWNVGVAAVFAPVVGLSVLFSQLRQRSFLWGIQTGIVFGGLWSAAFVLLGATIAAQQVAYGCIHEVMGPVHYLFTAKQWDELACCFAPPQSSAAHPLLATAPTDEKLREIGMKRAMQRSRESEKRKENAKYKRNPGAEEDEDLYAVLGVDRGASEKEIKAAFNRIAMKVHPDRNPSKEANAEFDRVTKAYRVLSNATKRKKYDLGGKSGLDDLGAKKRESLRAVFGGDRLVTLTGDVRLGSFSQRVIDGLDFTPDELAVQITRMRERSRDELLSNYLSAYSSNPVEWHSYLKGKLLRERLTDTGLAKEVLFVVGHEYLRACDYSRASPAQRLVTFVTAILPHRVRRKYSKITSLLTVRQSTFKDSAAMVDLAWHISVEELERTARVVALSVLLDPFSTPTSQMAGATMYEKDRERARRHAALRDLAEVFVANGRPYSGANKQTVDSMMDSLRSYQQAKSRQSE